MARIKRRRRVRCKLACEIVLSKGRRIPGRIVTISEGGLALVTRHRFDQGDPIRLLVEPQVAAEPIKVTGIVWNDAATKNAGVSTDLRRIGCVVSDPSRAYIKMFERLCRAEPRPEVVPIAKPQQRDIRSESHEPDLPRSREIQPPPKREPDDSLPYFQVRMKQIGGPRTRIITLRARSGSHAEELAHDELARVCKDAEGWCVLHIAKMNRRA